MNNEIKTIKRDSIKKNSIFNISVKLITYLVPLILTPYLYRTLSFSGVGTYEFQNAYVAYFCLVASFGFDNYGTKRISAVSDDVDELSKKFWSIFLAKVTLGTFALAVYFSMVFSGVFGGSDTYVVYCLLSFFILSSMTDITFFYQGIEKFKGIAFRTTLIKVLNLVLVFILVKTPNDYLKYVGIMSGTYLFSSLVMFLPLRKYIKFKRVKSTEVISDIKFSSIFFISTLATSLYTVFQKTILGLLTNDTQVGYYSSAMKIKDVIIQLCTAIIVVYYSRITYLVAQGKKEEALEKSYNCFNIIYDLVLPATFGLVCVSNVFMPLYFGTDASNAVPMMIYSAITLPIIATSMIILNSYFMPYNKQNKANIVYITTAIINLILTFILVKSFDGVGATIASLISEIYVVFMFVVFSKRVIDYRIVLNKGVKALVASLIMVILYYMGNKVLTSKISANKSMFIMIALSCVIYFALMILFKDDFIYGYYLKLKNKIFHKKK